MTGAIARRVSASLGGGAVAVELAATDGTQGLILENTFTSMTEVGKSNLKFVPASMIVTQKFDSLQKIENYTGPLLQTHGTRDEAVPYELGRKLFQRCGSGKKDFHTSRGGHNDAPTIEYKLLLARFLQTLKQPSQSGAEPATRTAQQHPEFDCRPNSRRGSRIGI